MHNVTNFDKLVLTWVKRYPSFAEVPKKVSYVLHSHFYIKECLCKSRHRQQKYEILKS